MSVMYYFADERQKLASPAGSSSAHAEFMRLHPKAEASLGVDAGGFYCYTHRSRSKSYPTIADIPKSVVVSVGSTG